MTVCLKVTAGSKKENLLNNRSSPSSTQNTTPSPFRGPFLKNRRIVLSSTLFPFFGSLFSQNDPTTVLNSVLSAYGLPTFKESTDLKPYDDIADDFYFDFPKSWVTVKDFYRNGVYISNFKTADKITVEVFPDELGKDASDFDVALAVVSKFVSPGDFQQNDRLELPPKNKIIYNKKSIDKQDYLYINFPSSTITRSGYQVRRKNIAVAAIRQNVIYALNASVRGDQATEEKAEMLDRVVESFRLR